MLLPAVNANMASLQQSEYLVKVTGFLIIPVVVAFTLLSLTRILTWKGRSYAVEGKPFAGSALRRWEVRTLQQKEEDTLAEPPRRAQIKDPSQLSRKQVAFLLVKASVSSAVVSVSMWQGR